MLILLSFALLVASCGGMPERSVSPVTTLAPEPAEEPDTTEPTLPSTTSTAPAREPAEEPDTTQPTPLSTTSTASAGPSVVELELSIFDWTDGNPPGNDAFVVVEGLESWTPNLEFGGDVRSFGGFEVGVPGTVLIYPDGDTGAEIRMTFVMTDEMISGSDMSITHVEIYDSEVLVWGQAIPGLEQSFDR